MGIEGVYLGYGIEVPYMKLASKLGIRTKKLTPRKIITKIEEHLAKNKFEEMQLSILLKSHSWERSTSGSSDDDEDIPTNVYFGVFVCIGSYDCWNDTKLSNSTESSLYDMVNNSHFSKVSQKMFGKSCNLMTVVTGCGCCS